MSIEEIRKKMREVGRFSKHCSSCGEIFGSDDIDKFLKMVEDHFKTCKGRQRIAG